MKDDDKGQVRAYAREALFLGVLLLEFNDSVHERHGKRLMRVWKFFMLIFRSVGKTKYTYSSHTSKLFTTSQIKRTAPIFPFC